MVSFDNAQSYGIFYLTAMLHGTSLSQNAISSILPNMFYSFILMNASNWTLEFMDPKLIFLYRQKNYFCTNFVLSFFTIGKSSTDVRLSKVSQGFVDSFQIFYFLCIISFKIAQRIFRLLSCRVV